MDPISKDRCTLDSALQVKPSTVFLETGRNPECIPVLIKTVPIGSSQTPNVIILFL